MRSRDVLAALRQHPEWVLVLVGLVVSIVFANHVSGSVGLSIVVAAIGVFAANRLHRLPASIRAPRERIAQLIALGGVVLVIVWTFWDQREPRGWMLGDYAGQRAALEQLVPALRDGHIPAYSLGLSTGESPFETYPALTYVIAAVAAIVTGTEDRLTDVLVIVAIVAHALIALNIVRVVYRIARPWTAFVIGAIMVVESGSVSAGGVVGTIEWGLVHSAVGQAFFMFAVVAVVDVLERPRLARAVTIWIATALATATHPSALLATAGSIVALAFVALLARDTPARRPLVAAGHLGIGAALGAVVWMPLGERMLQYGQHFSNALRSPAQLLEELLAWSHPPGLFVGMVYAGYVGLVLLMWSRGARRMFVGALGVILLLGFIDTPYVQFDLAPSQAAARIGTDRFHALARPLVFIAAGYLLALVASQIRAAWTTTKPRERAILGGVLGIVVALGLRAVVPFWLDLQVRARELAYHDSGPEGQAELTAWAQQQMRELGPGRYARAIFEDGAAFQHLHVTAETGLPSFHMGPLPDLLLRERIEDRSPASLRRFNVRWIVESDKSPSMGDPATEQRLGSYRIRELREWDGQFARIERGGGDLRTLELADERIRVELTNTSAPALVALGMGFYPRWRATDASGKPIKVYAYPSIPGGKLHVVAAWIPPGVTTFTVDGALPSDGKGRGLAGLALLAACATVVVWSRARWRDRVLRLVARTRRRIARRIDVLRIAAVAIISMGLVVWGVAARDKPMRALELGSGMRGYATVRAWKPGSKPEKCDYHRLEGRYRCAGLASFFDTTDTVLNDEQPLWPYTTPVIRMAAEPGQVVEYSIRIRVRLAGTYWIGSTGHHARVEVGDLPPFETTTQHAITLPDAGTSIRISGYAPASGMSLAFVREDTLRPPRAFLAPPPEQPPPSLAP